MEHPQPLGLERRLMRSIVICTVLLASIGLSLCNLPVLGGLLVLSLYVAALV